MIRRCTDEDFDVILEIVNDAARAYEKATELAGEAYKSGKGIIEVIREKKILTEEQIKDLLDPVKLTNLDKSKYAKN